jgi:hypothetical protein
LRVSKGWFKFKSVVLSQKEKSRYRLSRERPAYGLGETTGDRKQNAQSVNRNARLLGQMEGESLEPRRFARVRDRLAASAEWRGGFGSFGWAMWAAGTTRISSRLAVPRATPSWASNSKSLPAAFSTRRLTRKPPGTMRQLVRPMLSPGEPGYDRGRLTQSPGREQATTTHRMLYCCSTSPALPEAGETTSLAGRGYPTPGRRPRRRARGDASSLVPTRST